MKTESIYMKIVLTIIAACLLVIVIKPMAIQTAQAGRGEIVRVDIIKVGGSWVGKVLPVVVK